MCSDCLLAIQFTTLVANFEQNKTVGTCRVLALQSGASGHVPAHADSSITRRGEGKENRRNGSPSIECVLRKVCRTVRSTLRRSQTQNIYVAKRVRQRPYANNVEAYLALHTRRRSKTAHAFAVPAPLLLGPHLALPRYFAAAAALAGSALAGAVTA